MKDYIRKVFCKKNYGFIFGLILILLILVPSFHSYISKYYNDKEEIETSDEISNEYRDIYDDDTKIINNTGSVHIIGNTIYCWSSDEIRGKNESYTGIREMLKIDAKQDSEITLNYKLALKKGRFKVVLVTPDKKVEKILEYTSEKENKKEQEIKINVKQGENIIYIVGDIAKIKFDFSLKTSNDQIIIKNE